MSEPGGLEGRLRRALGGEHAPGRDGAHRAAGLDAARDRVVAGLRRRRMRRLQVAGGAAVVVLGLALSLPQVLGGAAPATQAGGAHSRSAASTFVPAVHGAANAGPSRTPGPPAVALCHLNARTVGACGTLTTGAAARALGATATSAEKAGAFGTSRSTTGLGSPLVVRVGTRVVVDLPVVKDGWRWGTPSIAGTPVYHGQGPPVTVRATHPSGATRSSGATRTGGATQQFLVATAAPVTVVLEAEDDVHSAPGAPPSASAGPAAVWALELKVEAR